MANALTGKEVNGVKNNTYTVVSFKDGKRTFTYGGVNVVTALQQVMNHAGEQVLVVNEQQAKALGLEVPVAVNDIRLYAKLFEVKWQVM